MPRHILQLDITYALQDLNELRKATGLQSYTHVIYQALRLFHWTVNATERDETNLLIEKSGIVRQVVFPFWSAVDNE